MDIVLGHETETAVKALARIVSKLLYKKAGNQIKPILMLPLG